jgi:hypothetical protein
MCDRTVLNDHHNSRGNKAVVARCRRRARLLRRRRLHAPAAVAVAAVVRAAPIIIETSGCDRSIFIR